MAREVQRKRIEYIYPELKEGVTECSWSMQHGKDTAERE